MTKHLIDNSLKSERLRDMLRQSIQVGQWKTHDRLPSEPELATQYSVSRSTVREAISVLVQDGLLRRVHGKGTFVAEEKPDHRTFAFMLPYLFFSDLVSSLPFGAGTDVIPRLMQAIEGEARRAKANVLFYLSHSIPSLERENIENVVERQVDGILMNYNGDGKNTDDIDLIRNAGIPLVFIDRYFDDIPIDFVVTDNERGAYEATRLLAAHGYTNIVHVCSRPSDHSSLRDRRAGFERAMKDMGRPAQVFVVQEPRSDETDGLTEDERAYKMTMTLLATAELPLAIFGSDAPILAGVWRAFRENGLPHDRVAFACFDEPFIDFPSSVFTLKVIQPFRKLGQQSIAILQERIAKTAPPEQYRIFIEPEIVVRKV
jgi:GntR family transcriptional regulator of arabinose operon